MMKKIFQFLSAIGVFHCSTNDYILHVRVAVYRILFTAIPGSFTRLLRAM